MSDYIEIKKECLLTWLDKQNIQCDCGTDDLYEEILDYSDDIAKNRYQQGRADAIEEVVNAMKSRYYHQVGTQFDNAILEMETLAEQLKEHKND